MRVLLTGGAGFVGSHVVEHLLKTTDFKITVIDRLDCSGNLNRLAEVGAAKNPRVRFVYHDLKAEINAQLAQQIGEHDYILHLAAGTHVDRSITNPREFVMDNVVGTCTMLDFARQVGCERFLYFSTDEVFGPAPPGVAYKEDDRYHSGNPYAATKAGGEELAVAYCNTYKVPVLVTHTMNVFGRRQSPEKFVPMTIQKIDRGEQVLIHADPTKTIPGSRFYVDAEDVASAVSFVLENGTVGEKYNIVGAEETDNLELARMIAKAVRKPLNHELVNFHESRPGHDLRYALDGGKLDAMGWRARPIRGRIQALVDWTLSNRQWLEAA